MFDGERIAAVIDFDTAHTGPRLRDIAYAVYRFAPLTNPRSEVSFGTLDDQAGRARVFVDTYGLEDRSGLVNAVCERLRDLVDFMQTRAANGDSNFARHLADGHDTSYLRDVDYLTRHAERITSHLMR